VERSRRYADARENYTRPEPLAWADFFIGWGRAIAAHGRGQHDDGHNARYSSSSLSFFC
jgi:hypothetical protein